MPLWNALGYEVKLQIVPGNTQEGKQQGKQRKVSLLL